jgi:hypothetical protein
MAVHKATRSNSTAQSTRPRPNHQLKADLFEALRHLNRGYGVALSALDRLEIKDRVQTKDGPRIFPAACLRDYRDRTETLRSQANHGLLQLMAGFEEREAVRFGRSGKTAKHR